MGPYVEAPYGLQVHVGHLIPDLSKASMIDWSDHGWNLMAQPARENMKLGRNPVTEGMARKWGRVHRYSGCEFDENEELLCWEG